MASPGQQLVQFPFVGGINQAVRDEVVDATQGVLVAENVRQNKAGAYSKRCGFAQQSRSRMGGTTRAAGYRVFSYGEQVCVIDGHQLDAYSSVASASVTRDRVPEALPKRLPMPYPGGTPVSADVVYANGYYVILSHPAVDLGTADKFTVHASVVDATTGAVLRTDELVTAATHSFNGAIVRLCAVGNTVIAVYPHLGGSTIRARTLSVASLADINTGWGAATALVTDHSRAVLAVTFDVHGMADRFALAYVETTTGSSDVTVKTFNTSLVQLHTVNVADVAAVTAVALAGSTTDTIWLAYGANVSAKVIGLASDLTTSATVAIISTVDTTVAALGIVVTGTGTGRLVFSEVGYARTAASGAITRYTQTSARSFAISGGAVVTSGDAESWANVVMTTRPFAVDGRYYCGVMPVWRVPSTLYGENTERGHFLIDIQNGSGTPRFGTTRPVATIAARQSRVDVAYREGTNPATISNLQRIAGWMNSHSATVSATKVAIVNLAQRFAGAAQTGTALEVVEFDFASQKRWAAVEFGDNVYLTGGVCSVYDGATVEESQFLVRPDRPWPIAGTIGSGSSITITNAAYLAIYEKTDASGNVSWSSPSDPSGSTGSGASGTNAATIAGSTMDLTGVSGIGATGQDVTGWFIHISNAPSIANEGTFAITNGLTVVQWTNASGVAEAGLEWTIIPYGLMTTAAQEVSVSVPTLSLTSHNDVASPTNPVRIAVYRSGSHGVLPYQRVAVIDNDPTARAVSFTDTTVEADRIASAQPYKNPGAPGVDQSHECPPALGILTVYGDMLVGVDDTGTTLRYSAQRIVGEAPWFSDVFQLPIVEGGEINALAALDGTLFVFKRRSIFALSGVAPVGSGAQGGLGDPRRLAADVGAISHVVCPTALGIFFVSERGLEILTRAQTVEWIGERVQDTLESYPNVTAITLDAKANVVYVELAAAYATDQVSGSGRTLVYDLAQKTWVSVDRRTNASGTADTPAQAAGLVYTGSTWRYGWLETNGTVHYEDTATHLDGGSYWVTMKVETGWIKASGLQGRQHVNRVLAMGKHHTSHDVNVSLAYDYATTYKTARLYTAAQVAALTTPLMQVEHTCHEDARGESIRIKLEDATPTAASVGTGQAGTWIGLAFEVVPQVGAFQLPDAAR